MVLGLAACGDKAEEPAASSKADTAEEAAPAAEKTADEAAPAAEADSAAPSAGYIADELNVGNNGSTVFIGSFDVSNYYSNGITVGSARLIYDSLFFVNNGKMDSRIFSEWSYSDDTTLVCQLKDNVTFSDGDPMTCEDILWSLGLYKQGYWGSNLEKLDVENSYYEGNTLYLKWFEAFAPGLNRLATQVMNKSFVEALIAEKGGQDNVDWFDLSVQCGSGPYVCVEQVTDSYAVFQLREDYWGLEEYGAPAKTINCYLYKDQTTMAIEFEQGKLDICYNIANTDAERAQNGEIEDCCLGLAYANTMITYVFSSIEPEFQDLNVRLAFAHALETDAITEMAYGVYGIPTTGMMSENMPYYKSGLVYEYDPDLSRELLATAGADGLSFTFSCMNVTQFSSMAESTQYYEDAVGIHMELNILDPFACIDLGKGGGQALWMNNECDGSSYEPSNMFAKYQAGLAPDMFRLDDTAMMEKIDAGVSTLDDEGRREIYEWLQQYEYDNCICVPICDYAGGYLYRPSVMDDPYTPAVNTPDLLMITMK